MTGRRSRYHVADPAVTSGPSRTSERGVTTVRLAQRHHGLPVMSAQYVVRMEDEGASDLAAGTSGRYFSDLAVDAFHPLGFAPARRAALHWLTNVRWRSAPG